MRKPRKTSRPICPSFSRDAAAKSYSDKESRIQNKIGQEESRLSFHHGDTRLRRETCLFGPSAPRVFFPLLILLSFLGCQYDPHAHLLTIAKPSHKDLIGVYVVDRFDLPQIELAGRSAEITVELRADGTFLATNVPPDD